MRRTFIIVPILLTLAIALPVFAQGDDAIPDAYQLTGFRHEFQMWNNCGPATLTTALSYYGWEDDQTTAAIWLKPDPEDKNVSPDQMAAFVNNFTEVNALIRYGTDVEQLRQLVANDFPVIIAAGYEPEGYEWMGHYLLVMGYDKLAGTFLTQDSFLGPDTSYSQEELEFFWRHFNRVMIVLYPGGREAELMQGLGQHADAQVNAQLALDLARLEASENQADPYAWFNVGTNFLLLGQPGNAAIMYDQARNAGGGLPWRFLWYQFGPFEAYYQTERYEDVIALAEYNLATTPSEEHPIEETFYYAGLAREAMGNSERAILNYQEALFINPNFQPAADALNAVQSGSAG